MRVLRFQGHLYAFHDDRAWRFFPDLISLLASASQGESYEDPDKVTASLSPDGYWLALVPGLRVDEIVAFNEALLRSNAGARHAG